MKQSEYTKRQRGSCENCGVETTGKVPTCDGGEYFYCRECKKDVYQHEHDPETGECLL